MSDAMPTALFNNSSFLMEKLLMLKLPRRNHRWPGDEK
jgi:hypothetical protein